MFRVASYNLENFDEVSHPHARPRFEDRAAAFRPALERLRTDIVGFREINGQERTGQPRDLRACAVLKETRFGNRVLISSRLADGSQVHEPRDVVTAIPPGCQFGDVRKINGDVVPNPVYHHVVAGDETPKRRTWERPQH